MKNFSIEMIRKTKTMTLQEYLKSDLAKERALHLDLMRETNRIDKEELEQFEYKLAKYMYCLLYTSRCV